MLIGIDVGGTYTDAVLLDDGLVLANTKVQSSDDILMSLMDALDRIMKGVPAELIERVVVSTTLITNLIAEKKYDPVGLILIPGPGLSHANFKYPTDTFIVAGAIDYRGREISPINQQQVEKALQKLKDKGYQKIAVVGKFSLRNSKHEKDIAAMAQQIIPGCQVEMGHQAAGQLGFPRRVVSTILNCATRNKYHFFIDSVNEALKKRNIGGTYFILKADGGTMPLNKTAGMPIETIFSGPAASTLGVQSLLPPGETAVVVDIGGTTTDLALILGGHPLMSSRGAKVEEQMTQVRALAVKSVPVGGDCVIERIGNEIMILSDRMGAPYCKGGPMPTPSDALRVLGLSGLGNLEKAREATEFIGRPLGMSCNDVSNYVTTIMVEVIAKEIELMFEQWEQEPAYRVWEVLQKRKERPKIVVGVGGGAYGLISQIAARMNCYPVIPSYAPVANAIGAAVAIPTLQVNLRADTEQGFYTIEEEGYQGEINKELFAEEDAMALANDWLMKRVESYGLEKSANQTEITRRDVFTMVRDWVTIGKIFDICIQTPRGIVGQIGARGAFNEQR